MVKGIGRINHIVAHVENESTSTEKHTEKLVKVSMDMFKAAKAMFEHEPFRFTAMVAASGGGTTSPDCILRTDERRV